ncbi:MAG: hypothetical protein ABL879_14370, partial [Devosia sp.]
MAEELSLLLAAANPRGGASPLRDLSGVLPPVDADTKQSLIRIETSTSFEPPILEPSIVETFAQVVAEQRHLGRLAAEGLSATK